MLRLSPAARCMRSYVRATPLKSHVRNSTTVSAAARQVQAEADARFKVQAAMAARHRVRLSMWTFAAGAFICLGSYALGSAFPPSILRLISPRPAAAPPPPDSPEALAHARKLESALQSLPQVVALRRQTEGDLATHYEARPYQSYPPERAVNSLTAGALRGAGRLAIAPLVFARRDETEAKLFVHVGRGLCGHDGIVHGGLTATLLDEAQARQAVLNFPSHLGVTATLTVNYRAPVMADQFIIIETKLESVQGRKATVSGRITDLSGKLLVESSALFVEPKYAKYLANEDVKHLLGVQTKPAVAMEKKENKRTGTGDPMPMAGEKVVHGAPSPHKS